MDTTQLPWQPLRANVTHKRLDRIEDLDLQCDLMQIEPNTQLERHLHPKFEWAYVLRGEMTDERGTFATGHFIKNDAQSVHTAHSGPDGVDLLVVWSGRVLPINA